MSIEQRVKTLMRYSRKDLAEKCAILEHNNKALKESLEIQYQNCVTLVDDMSMLNKRFKEARRLYAPLLVEPSEVNG